MPIIYAMTIYVDILTKFWHFADILLTYISGKSLISLVCRESCFFRNASKFVYNNAKTLWMSFKGSSRPYLGHGICHFYRRVIGKVDSRISGNGMRYTHRRAGNAFTFLFDKRERYDLSRYDIISGQIVSAISDKVLLLIGKTFSMCVKHFCNQIWQSIV